MTGLRALHGAFVYLENVPRFGERIRKNEAPPCAAQLGRVPYSMVGARIMLHVDQLLCLVTVPVEASPALQQAVHLAAGGSGTRTTRATLHVVPLAGDDPSDVEEAVQRQRAPDNNPIAVETTAFEDDAPEELCCALQRYAETIEADLLVLDAPTDRGSIPPLADDWRKSLLDALDCSVFSVGTETTPKSMERVLLPTDLSDESVQTLQYATELAAGYDASILLLHVIETSPYVALTPVDRLSLGQTTLSEHRARRRLQEMLKKGRSSDVSIGTRLVFGDPADRIARFVTEADVDLLVLAPGADHPSEDALGRVADRVLRRVACSTVLVRGDARSVLPGRSEARSTAGGDE
jgi:nucleotide-binding universal stress UspA family protein